MADADTPRLIEHAFPLKQASLARFHNGHWVFFGPLVAARP